MEIVSIPILLILTARQQSLRSLHILLTTSNTFLNGYGDGPFTIFAPVNEALPVGLDLMMLQLTPGLHEFLRNHVVAGRYSTAELANGTTLTTLGGTTVTIQTTPTLMANDAMISGTDLEFDSGVVHTIEKTLVDVPTM